MVSTAAVPAACRSRHRAVDRRCRSTATVVAPLGVDHVMLNVSSLDKALPYYRGVYGRPREA
jgi:hypothetical protein